jgi:hypothetical protein
MKFLLAKLFESAKVSFCDRESKLFMTGVVEHKLFIIAEFILINVLFSEE